VSFRNILKDLVDGVEGSLGAIFIDGDGEEVEHFASGDSANIKLLGAYSSIHLRNMQRITKVFCSGKVGRAILSFDQCILLLSPVADGYYILLLLEPGGNIGKGMMRIETTVNRILEEL
jgi:predicted regulator of Ras-like GTPase activity (Roadblock/LC7/MglB family)